MEREPRRETPPGLSQVAARGSWGARCTPRRMGARVWGGKGKGGSVGFLLVEPAKMEAENWSGRPERAETGSTPPAPALRALAFRIQGRGRRARARAVGIASARAQRREPSPRAGAARVGLGIRTCAADAWRAARVSRVSRFMISFFFLRKSSESVFFCPEKVQNQLNGTQNSKHNT